MKRTIEEQLEAIYAKKRENKEKFLAAGAKANRKKTAMKGMKTSPMSDPIFKSRVKEVQEVLKDCVVKPKGKSFIPQDTELKIIAEYFVSGRGQGSIEASYGLARGYINHVLNRRFGDKEKLKQALYDLNLENAVVAQMIFQKKAEELSAKDAAIASGIFTQKFAELERLTEKIVAPQLDVKVTLQLEETLSKLRTLHGPVIDIEPKK